MLEQMLIIPSHMLTFVELISTYCSSGTK